MFKAAAVVSDTKRVLKNLDGQGLAELRALQKPDNEIEDLLAAIIIIGMLYDCRNGPKPGCAFIDLSYGEHRTVCGNSHRPFA